MATTRQLTAIIEREDDGYVALCPELDIASQGDSVEKARTNLAEAIEFVFLIALPVFADRPTCRHAGRDVPSLVFFSRVSIAMCQPESNTASSRRSREAKTPRGAIHGKGVGTRGPVRPWGGRRIAQCLDLSNRSPPVLPSPFPEGGPRNRVTPRSGCRRRRAVAGWRLRRFAALGSDRQPPVPALHARLRALPLAPRPSTRRYHDLPDGFYMGVVQNLPVRCDDWAAHFPRRRNNDPVCRVLVKGLRQRVRLFDYVQVDVLQ